MISLGVGSARPWVTVVLASAILCAAASRNILQGDLSVDLPDNIRIDGPFPSDTPDDCAAECVAVDGCRGYRWRGQECSLTIQVAPGSGTTPTPSSPKPDPDTTTTEPIPEMPTEPAEEPEPEAGVDPVPETPEEPPTDTGSEEGDGNVTTPEEIEKFLLNCQNVGSLSAAGAALAACTVITNKCPIPPEPEDDDFEPVALSDLSPPQAALDVLNMTLEESCKVVTIQTCKNEAFNQAEVLNPDCHRVLDLGPSMEDTNPDCADKGAANVLFSGEVGSVCEGSAADDAGEELDDGNG